MAAEIIAVTQQKGGVGKSTIAMDLAAGFGEIDNWKGDAGFAVG